MVDARLLAGIEVFVAVIETGGFARAAKALGLSRFDMKYSSGTLPHDKMMRSITLYGSKVMPLVRDMLA